MAEDMMPTLLNENVPADVAHQGRYFKQFPVLQNAAPEMRKRVWQSRKT
ncbi:hypothetical protein K9B32_00175 [Rhizobium sp. 3T7]|jgi:hypothetical protein|nr:hypothetical protein [Rhizobium sp. 3T7]MBZ9788559.1 hypothetical protein [Rhizobium sp. 3T7]